MVFRIYNVQDSNGVTPLMIAVKKQNTSAIKHLVAHKEVDLNLRDSKGNNVYHYAARTEKEIIEVQTNLQIAHDISEKLREINLFGSRFPTDYHHNTKYFQVITKLHCAVREFHEFYKNSVKSIY